MIVAIDFDGTIVTHEFPAIGIEVPEARSTIQALVDNGHQVFLYTMRDRQTLQAAADWLEANGFPIDRFNNSPAQFSTSPKQFAHLYIDDAALGCPKTAMIGLHGVKKTVVDWFKIKRILISVGLIQES